MENSCIPDVPRLLRLEQPRSGTVLASGLIISLWPLVKRHHWTYCDLLNVVRSLISRSDAYPCRREQDFTVHCRTVLGLRKTRRGKTAKNGKPPGHAIARQIFTAALSNLTLRASGS